jgi:hypothetical protein
VARTAGSIVVEGTLRTALAGAMQDVFVIAFLAAALGFVVTALAPRGRIDQLVTRRANAEDRRSVRPATVTQAAEERREQRAME